VTLIQRSSNFVRGGFPLKHHLFVILIVMMVGALTGFRANADQPKTGERHPDFTLPRISDGQALSLSDFRGKKVLLIQFASW